MSEHTRSATRKVSAAALLLEQAALEQAADEPGTVTAADLAQAADALAEVARGVETLTHRWRQRTGAVTPDGRHDRALIRSAEGEFNLARTHQHEQARRYQRVVRLLRGANGEKPRDDQ